MHPGWFISIDTLRLWLNITILYNIMFVWNVPLKTESCYDNNFVVSGGCRYEKRRCPKWRQSWHHDDSVFSVVKILLEIIAPRVAAILVHRENELMLKLPGKHAIMCHNRAGIGPVLAHYSTLGRKWTASRQVVGTYTRNVQIQGSVRNI